MKFDDMILVSVDDHIIEPPNVFENHIPKRWADRAPRFGYDAKRRAQTWTWEGGVAATPFICAVVTLPSDEWGYDPSTLAEMRPGCYDSEARVRDMDANGILASMCFPSFAGMGGSFFANCQDRELAYACLQAYNDWHIDEWAGSHPGRFIPLPLCALWSPGALGAGGAARGAQGRHRDRVLRGARDVRLSEHPQRRVGSVLRRVPGRGRDDRDPHRLEQHDAAGARRTRRSRSRARCRAGTRSPARRTSCGASRS